MSIQINSSGEIKKLGLTAAVLNKLLAADAADYADMIQHYSPVLRKENTISHAVAAAEKALEPYLEFLD